jgi:pyrroline-5-carboxylate reductase
MLTNQKVAIIGIGKMGETLARALVEGDVLSKDQVFATAKHPEKAEEKAKALGIRACRNEEAVREARILVLSVKPQAMEETLLSIASELTPEHLLISTAASVSTSFIERTIGKEIPVIRTMPNTPCLLRNGMTGIAAGRHVQQEHMDVTRAMFESMGRCMILDEKHMDAVTGLSGSGPAFMYVVLESLAEGGVKVGLPRDVATELVAQTMLGAAKMVLETREHPAKLKDGVTTPAGCTIDGLLELEEGGLRVALIKAVVGATERASELLDE